MLKSNLPRIIAEIEAAARRGGKAGAELVAQTMRDRVAFDPNEPHHVRDAIHLQETEEGVLVVAGDKDAWWGHMIEHGTTHSPPQPFAVPSLEENRGAIEELVAEEIRRAV